MPNSTQNLRHAEAQHNPDLTFSHDELLEEINKGFGLEERQEGDIDAFELSRLSGKTINPCRTYLRKLAEEGKLIAVKVRGDNGVPLTVYRKPESSPECIRK